MERIGVIGASGGVRSALVPRLAADGWPLRLIGRRRDRLEAVATALPSRSDVECVAADARAPDSLCRAVEGCGLTVVASATLEHAGPVATAIMEAGSDYLDVQLSSERKHRSLEALRALAERTGRCLITDGGYHPGVPAVLVRWACERFPNASRAEVGALMRENWREIVLDASTAAEFVREIAGTRYVAYEGGRWRWPSGRLAKLDFGAPYGMQRVTPFCLDEMLRLPERFPSLRVTGFFLAGFDPWTDWVTFPFLFAAMRLSGGRAAAPLGRWLFRSMRRGARPPYGVVLTLRASCEGGETLRLRLSHADGYAMTAIPVQATLRQWRDRRPPGLHHQAWFVEPERFLADLAGLGVEVTLGTGATPQTLLPTAWSEDTLR